MKPRDIAYYVVIGLALTATYSLNVGLGRASAHLEAATQRAAQIRNEFRSGEQDCGTMRLTVDEFRLDHVSTAPMDNAEQVILLVDLVWHGFISKCFAREIALSHVQLLRQELRLEPPGLGLPSLAVRGFNRIPLVRHEGKLNSIASIKQSLMQQVLDGDELVYAPGSRQLHSPPPGHR